MRRGVVIRLAMAMMAAALGLTGCMPVPVWTGGRGPRSLQA